MEETGQGRIRCHGSLSGIIEIGRSRFLCVHLPQAILCSLVAAFLFGASIAGPFFLIIDLGLLLAVLSLMHI